MMRSGACCDMPFFELKKSKQDLFQETCSCRPICLFRKRMHKGKIAPNPYIERLPPKIKVDLADEEPIEITPNPCEVEMEGKISTPYTDFLNFAKALGAYDLAFRIRNQYCECKLYKPSVKLEYSFNVETKLPTETADVIEYDKKAKEECMIRRILYK